MYKQNYFNEPNEIKTLMGFIKSDLNQITLVQKQYQNQMYATITFMKLKYDENNIFIYYIFNCEDDFKFQQNFKYGGFYNLITNMFYGADYTIKELIYEDCDTKGIYDLKQEIIKNIFNRICEIIDNFNDCSLEEKAKKLLKETDQKQIEIYKQHYAKFEAISMFLDGKNPIRTDFSSLIDKNYSTEDMVNYLNEKDKFIEFKARGYIEHNLSSIYTRFICNKFIIKEYKKIINDKENILHIKKKISDCITNQKTVNVTILRNGIEFTFKTDASSLIRGKYSKFYCSFYINARDRELFYERFGENADYTADEIIKVTHCKKVIYEKAG